MKFSVSVLFRCESERVALSLKDTLAPDNVSVPHDQSFETSEEGEVLRFTIASERPSSVVSSALGLITDATLFASLWYLNSGARRGRGRPG